MFRVGGFMFIGKFIHYANKIAGNVSSRHHLELGSRVWSATTNASTNTGALQAITLIYSTQTP